MPSKPDRLFNLTERGTTVRTEVTAGLTTFAAMAYILAVNPQILSTTGMDFGAVVTATALASAIMTAVFAIVAVAIAGAFIPGVDGSPLTKAPERWLAPPASLSPTFLAFDFAYVFEHWRQALPLVLAFLFVDLFDNMGTLIGVCSRLGLLDSRGELPGIGRALSADAGAAMLGSALGTSTVTSYIESAAGTEEGGRTGLTALVVSLCFLASLVFHPLLRVIPVEATAPALVIVGCLMMQGVVDLDLRDFIRTVPSILTIVLMPLTFSISEGLALGFVFYCGLMLLAGRRREVSLTGWILGVTFLLHLLTR